MKTKVVLAAGVLWSLAALASGGTAHAALTSSEKAQIRDFTAAAQLENAGRVRALVARTDLSEAESVAAMSDALETVALDASRSRFLREVVFGPSSAPSRSVLALAVVRALLARADVVHQKYVGGLDHEPSAVAELASIYAWIDGEIANAGRTTLPGHDPNAGIPAAAYEECSKALREHVDKHARWLKGDGPVPESASRLRAQAQIAVLDLLPDGPARRVDAADRIGAKGARRQMLVDWGLLVEGGGKLDEQALERVRKVLAVLPGARAETSVLLASEDKGPIRAKAVARAIGERAPQKGASPFGDELANAPYDATLGAVLLDLATAAAKRALDEKPALRDVVTRDVAAANAEGRALGFARSTAAPDVLGAAVHLLLVDAPRAVDLAMVRHVAGHSESLALLSDALGVLAAQGLEPIEVAASGGTTRVTAVKLTPSGVVVGFTMDGAAWTVERAEGSSVVLGARRGGQPVSLLHLASAKVPMKDGDRWAEGELAFARLRGGPRVGIVPAAPGAPGPTLEMTAGGAGAKSFEAIGMTTPDDDVVVEADLTVRGGPAGIGVRMGNGRDGLRGALLIVAPGVRTSLLASDDAGFEALLAAPLEPAIETPVHVRIAVRGTKISALVGTTKLEGTLPASLAKGDVGLVAKPGASVGAAGWSVKKAGAAAGKPSVTGAPKR